MKRKIADLKLHPLNIAIYGKPDTGLRDSLENFGQQHPIAVDRENLILSGARRWAAAKSLGWDDIECDLVNGSCTEADIKKYILLANAYRGEKNAAIQWAEAEAYRELLATGELTKAEAAQIGKDKGAPPPRAGKDRGLVPYAAAAAGISEDTYRRLNYVLGDGAEEDIASAKDNGDLTARQADKLCEQIESARDLLRSGDATAKETERVVRSAIRNASKSRVERQTESEADALMSVLKRVQSARDAVGQLRTMNPKVAPRIAVAIAGCIAEMVMTIESVTAKHRIAVPHNRKDLAKLADIEEADVLSME